MFIHIKLYDDLSCFIDRRHATMTALGDTQDDDSPGGSGFKVLILVVSIKDLFVPSEMISTMSFLLEGILPAP